MKSTLMIPALIALFAAPAAFAGTLTMTGNNGGTIEKNRDCVRVEGSAECAVNTTKTSPGGETASKERTRTTGGGSSATTVTRTGPGGQTNTRKRLISVLN